MPVPSLGAPVLTTEDEDKVLQAIETVAADGATRVNPKLSSPWTCKVYTVGSNVVRVDFVKPKNKE